MKKILKKPLFIILAILVLFILGLVIFSKKKAPYDLVIARKGNITQEVSVTGRIKSAESVDLAFEKSGKIISAPIEVADKVISGQILAQLENSELVAQLKEAEASIEAQRAKLTELKKGARPEEIQAKEAEMKKVNQDLANYYSGAVDIINDAFVKADDAVRAKTDELFTNDETNDPQLTFSVSDSQTERNVKSYRAFATKALNDWQAGINNLTADSTASVVEMALENPGQYLQTIRDFLVFALEAANKSLGLPLLTVEKYKTNINTGRTNVSTAITSINTRRQAIAVQKITVEKTQSELNLLLAGSTDEEIAIQEAMVKQAEAKRDAILAQISKTILRSPIKGIVTKKEVKVGEIIVANAVVFSLILGNQFEIEANIAEADIAKVKIGNRAKITLDAYGNEVIFEAAISKIDPAETIIEGVATYKVVLQLEKEDERIKSGMTANIDILTASRENVVIIPEKAIFTKNGDKFVKVLSGKKEITEVKVKTGLRGFDGSVEITEGISEGEQVIVSSNSVKAK